MSSLEAKRQQLIREAKAMLTEFRQACEPVQAQPVALTENDSVYRPQAFWENIGVYYEQHPVDMERLEINLAFLESLEPFDDEYSAKVERHRQHLKDTGQYNPDWSPATQKQGVFKSMNSHGSIRPRMEWTDDLDRRLLELHGQGLVCSQIAKKMKPVDGRVITESMVRGRLRTLKLAPHNHGRTPWTQAEKDEIVRLVLANWDVGRIAGHLGKPYASVYKFCRRQGLEPAKLYRRNR